MKQAKKQRQIIGASVKNMKIRRPITDNEIAVYGNGVFIVIYRNVLRLYFACKIEIYILHNFKL